MNEKTYLNNKNKWIKWIKGWLLIPHFDIWTLTENKVRTFTIKMRDSLKKIEYILSQAKTT